ncbi:MAG TPA: hypothetical protein VHE09_16065, partial [Rhizomicrobium sp.]|nr:hypothetical protein [Rhizomicrobium sp.]
MNARIVVAQATSTAAGNAPVQVIHVVKPEAGKTVVFHASFDGSVKVDFSAIASEKITLYHDNADQTLHIIFADGSQAIIEPFFDSQGKVLGNLTIEVGSGQDIDGAQFAATFPITTDQSVLPAAGNGNNASGADFHDPSVDPLGVPGPLGLLGPEELPPIQFNQFFGHALNETFGPPTVSGNLTLFVEEEELHVQFEERIPSEAGNGNEDTRDLDANDKDTLFPFDFNNTRAFVEGDLSPLVHGVAGQNITFSTRPGANGSVVHDNNGHDVTSLGEIVKYVVVSPTEIQGWAFTTDGAQDRLIFTLDISKDGKFTFTLLDQIDHPNQSHDDAFTPHGAHEETLNLDLSTAIDAQDQAHQHAIFHSGTFEIGVIDDTPIVVKGAHEHLTVDEDDIDTHLSQGTSPDDGNHDGSFTGSQFNENGGPATVSGYLSQLVSVGADAVDVVDGRPFGTFSLSSGTVSYFLGLGLESKGHELSYQLVDLGGGKEELIGFVNNQGIGQSFDPQFGDRLVFKFELTNDETGQFEFKLYDQLDHDPGHGQNTDLVNDVPGPVNTLNFGKIIEFSDADGDSVNLDHVFTITIRDDVPQLLKGADYQTVDEDDISTLQDGLPGGSLGTSPDDGNSGDGSFTGNPLFSTKGPADVFGSLTDRVDGGADDPLKFSLVHNADNVLARLGLESQGHELSYQVVGDTLIGFVNAQGIGHSFDPQDGDRLIFTFTIKQNGDYSFKLFDQLDHVPGHGQNTDLVNDVPGSVSAIDFGQLVQATDFDGDSVTLDNKLFITIRDDIPQVISDSRIALTVAEDDISTLGSSPNPGSLGTGPDDGNSDGSFTGDPNNETGGPANVSGTLLGSVVAAGADEPLTFSFAANTVEHFRHLGLQSAGRELSYQVVGDTLYGF